jgi:flagellar motor switch protein FliN/FliY
MAEQATGDAPAVQAQPADIFPAFGGGGGNPGMLNELDMILDIPVQITVELGRTKITIKNLLQLAHGSVVELDAMAGEPMDVLVNGTMIAQGEGVVVNDKFGIRLDRHHHAVRAHAQTQPLTGRKSAAERGRTAAIRRKCRIRLR